MYALIYSTLLLHRFDSTQMQTDSSRLGTTTFLHTYWWVYLPLWWYPSIPFSQVLWNCSRSDSGIETCRGMRIACGAASGFSWIWQGSSKFPNPWNSIWNFLIWLWLSEVFEAVVESTFFISPRALAPVDDIFILDNVKCLGSDTILPVRNIIYM